ncbi:MAG TPA: DUF692 family protein [Acidimicrobiales bacterium]|nr:DUF692 family protein [Acidimicrobiales bacterium]
MTEAAGVLARKAAKAGERRSTEGQGDGRGADRHHGPPAPTLTGGARARAAPAPSEAAGGASVSARSPALGCSYRPALVPLLFDELHRIDVWEHIADWYRGPGGDDRLRRFARATPVTLHSLAMSIGSSPDQYQQQYVHDLARLARVAEVDHVSDHLAFSRVGPQLLPHFLPLWRIEEQLELVAENVDRVQDELGARLLLENPASPLDPGGDLSTAEFLNELCGRTGCAVLLDLENLRVNADNGQLDAAKELETLELRNVAGVHLAGGTDPDDEAPAFDAHAWPVHDRVLAWLAGVVPEAPDCRWVVVERDGRLEQGEEVAGDLDRIRRLLHAD